MENNAPSKSGTIHSVKHALAYNKTDRGYHERSVNSNGGWTVLLLRRVYPSQAPGRYGRQDHQHHLGSRQHSLPRQRCLWREEWLLTLTCSVALELAPQRINVNAVSPGPIRTPMTKERADDPREVSRIVLYLVSDEADHVTGQGFTIDGGLEMNWGQGA
jgi:hypothetical protein